jgi:prepilin-type N-terminal cleavage/methylation domain-containing protein
MSLRAFTLIELLVVVAIIAILVAILIPTIALMKEQARSSACLSNVRQLVTAFQTYGTDNDGSVPEYWITTNANLNWCVTISPYVDSLQVGRQYGATSTRRAFKCPNADIVSAVTGTTWSLADGNGYGINVWLGYGANESNRVAGADSPGSGLFYKNFLISQVTMPTSRAWVGDAQGYTWGRNWNVIDGSTWRDPNAGTPANARKLSVLSPSGNPSQMDAGDRHGWGYTCVAFFDGHAERIPLQRLIYALFDPAQNK